MKKYYFIVSFLLVTVFQVAAQSIERQATGSGGTVFITEDGVSISQTIGQPYATTSYYGTDCTIHPGFQQPISIDFSTATPDNALRAYPIPASDHINIAMENVLPYAIVEVHDISGKIVFRQLTNNLLTYTVNLAGLSEGVYALALTDEFNNMYSSKFIISR